MFSIISNVCHIAVSLWAASQSYTAINNLQKYEEPSKKAAQVLEKAEHELHKTRTTQTSGALIVTANLTWSTLSLLGIVRSPGISLFGWLGLSAGLYFTQEHLKNFWNAKSNVPLLKNYNEGVQSSKMLIGTLSTLRILAGIQVLFFASEILIQYLPKQA